MRGVEQMRTAGWAVRVGYCVGVIAGAVFSAGVRADVSYDITALGLTDSLHRRADGYCNSGWIDYNDKGGVIGSSSRWSGYTYTGSSAWFYENKVVTRIGLWDAAHTRSDGYGYSRPIGISDSNQVLGVSGVYAGNYEAQTAWIYSNGVTRALGLTGAGYIATNGLQSSFSAWQNASGQVTGYSGQYTGNNYLGSSAWVFNNGVTLQIGRTASDAIASDGHSWDQPEYLSETGYVAGWGAKYSAAGAYLGHVPWVYFNGQTRDIGPVGSQFTASNGSVDGRTHGVSINGHIIGESNTYSGTTYTGVVSWIYYQGTTRQIGLTGGIYVNPGGSTTSNPLVVNDRGQVAGWSTQYIGGATGGSAWVYDGAVTRRAGLVDALHTKSDGTSSSIVRALNNRGDGAGYSQQRDGSGLSAFYYANGVSTRIGLLDAKHATPQGHSANSPDLLNSAGQIAGLADRVNGYSGATAWFYDPLENHTYPLDFSESSGGFAVSVVQYLADDGVCLGRYTLFDGSTDVGDHAFYWSVAKGFHDLGSLSAGSLGAQGWERLYDGIVINGNGDVICKGTLGQWKGESSLAAMLGSDPGFWGDVPAILTVVPEPSSVVVMLGTAALLLRRKRQV